MINTKANELLCIEQILQMRLLKVKVPSLSLFLSCHPKSPEDGTGLSFKPLCLTFTICFSCLPLENFAALFYCSMVSAPNTQAFYSIQKIGYQDTTSP